MIHDRSSPTETYRQRLERRSWLLLESTAGSADGTDDASEATDHTTLRAVVLQDDPNPETEESDESDATRVSGVIIGEGDVTVSRTDDGDQRAVEWPGEVLEAAVEDGVFDEIPITEDHPEPEAPQPPARAVIGEVLEVDYEAGVGVTYEGEIDDDEIAEAVENGRLDVSAVLAAEASDPDDGGVYVAQRILGVRDLGVVARGAAPSNSIEPAEATALAAPGIEPPGEPGDYSVGEDVDAGEDAEDDESDADSADADADPLDDFQTITDMQRELKALRDENDRLRDEVGEMRAVFADVLEDATPFDAETIADRFDFAEICTALEGAGYDSAADALALTPNPRTGSRSTAGDGEVRTEALEASPTSGAADAADDRVTREDLLALQRRIETLEGTAPEAHVESLRDEAAALAGVDDYAEIAFDDLR